MYGKILVPLDTTATDRVIVEHVKRLAHRMKSSVVLLHVADGWAARTFRADAAGAEVAADEAYIERVRAEFADEGIPAVCELAFGEPGDEIVKWVAENGCDLVAMGTHGHRIVADIVLGSTVWNVRHKLGVPLLLVRSGAALPESWHK